MKKVMFITLIILLFVSAGMAHMMKEDRYEGRHDFPDNRMEGYKFFGWGMHGPQTPDCGCGHEMMSHEYCGTMGHQGMLPGMMGYGMGPGMGGFDADRYDTFMRDTIDMRREFHNREFDYNEALRNRDVKHDDLIKMEKEMLELQMKIREKWWNRTD
ncbi:MAG: hypothetical protein JSW20_00410 [Nitrospiraceae bacterium]|nr:MAG: hypothetical protein JSW20_00410 [Nitrospiraceae bacterium]